MLIFKCLAGDRFCLQNMFGKAAELMFCILCTQKPVIGISLCRVAAESPDNRLYMLRAKVAAKYQRLNATLSSFIISSLMPSGTKPMLRAWR